MKGLKKALVAVMTVAAMAAAFVTPVAADFTYDAVKGGEMSFKKYFVVDEDVEFPEAKFTFTIQPTANAIPATATTMEVLKGVDGATVGEADFSTAPAASDVYDAVQTGDSSITLNTGMKYAKKEVKVDFSACEFPEPGVYRYELKENNGGVKGIDYDTSVKYIDVYVVDRNGTLVTDDIKYVMHTSSDAPATGTDAGTAGGSLADKIDGIQNNYNTTDLYVGKTVTGNQGSRDKYFRFKVDITGLNANAVINVDIANADATSGTTAATKSEYRNKTNETSLTADSDGKITAYYYLQSGQYVILQGLTEGATYEVTEDAEDYKSIAANTSSFTLSGLTFKDKTSDAVEADQTSGNLEPIYTGFTNTRDGEVPTGITEKIVPVIVIGAVVVAGIVFFAVRSTKRKSEEEA